MTQIRRLLVTLSMVGLLSACSVTFDAATLGVKASVSEPAGPAPEGTGFVVDKKACLLHFGSERGCQPLVENVRPGTLLRCGGGT